MYIVEGNIGVGKSTFLEELQQQCMHLRVIFEPVDAWTAREYDSSLLQKFYTNPTRWAYTMELFTMIRRVRDHVTVPTLPHAISIMERSVYSGHYCFAQNGRDQGFFSDLEWNIYQQWVTFLIETQCQTPRGFIYLKADPEVCYQRIQSRARNGEHTITLNYLRQIDVLHDQFLIAKKGVPSFLGRVPVLILDCSNDFKQNKQTMKRHLEQVESFFAATEDKKI